ncbi:class I SAM-dependent methyltransferase [uncultured Roseivirga sp.]|uniref:O-methyltransferase n=1 Tax=uncultured Roseivirga sp. TaxID=543088 RepID=UPI00258AC2CC|nr:class I SAM-dependent methyltransferase [uncultured Roseivirga sp.]
MFQVLAFLKYWLLQADEHSLHSPFVFNLYNNVIKTASRSVNPKIEELRNNFLTDQTPIELVDFGAGSRVKSGNQRTVSEIVKNSSTPPKFSALLKSLAVHLELKNIVELGTSLGLNTLYLSEVENSKITTFEGDPSLSTKARKTFSDLGKHNIRLIEGDIDQTLASEINSIDRIDMAYIDANHRYEPTLRYYETILAKCNEISLILLDDIHWSKEMNQAWTEIKSRPEVIVSIDLFEGGLLFFDPKLTRGDYVLRF